MMKLVVVFAIVLCISVTAGLKCYTCSSTTSLEDCAKNKKEQDCGQLTDPRCVTQSINFKVLSQETKNYAKLCNTKVACDVADTAVLQACKLASNSTCEYKCCEKDLCNSGAVPVASILLMVPCAVVGFFR